MRDRSHASEACFERNPGLYHYFGVLAGGMYYYGWQNNTPFINVISKPYWIIVTVIITTAVTAFVYLNAKKDEQHRNEMEKKKRGNNQP